MKTFTELYGDGEFRSSRGVREPVLQYTEPEEGAQALNYALESGIIKELAMTWRTPELSLAALGIPFLP